MCVCSGSYDSSSEDNGKVSGEICNSAWKEHGIEPMKLKIVSQSGDIDLTIYDE